MSIVQGRRALLWLLLAFVAFAPAAVGALPARVGALTGGAVLALAVYAFSFSASTRPRQVALVLLSACFALGIGDLLARRVVAYVYENRPVELYSRHWRPLPLLTRFAPNVSFEGETYGDLAAMSMRRDWREVRRTRFVTDAHGFRNDPAHQPPGGRYDVILVGDSYGVAGPTRQEETLSGRLARDYGLGVYNLSTDGAGPWQGYANLLVEGERLNAREGATVLWLIFAGNDLDDLFHPYFEKSQLPWQDSALGHPWGTFQRFRWRSPLRRVLFGAEEEASPGRVVERQTPDGRRLLFLNLYAARRLRTADDVRRHANYERLRATFGAMRRLAASRGLKVSVALAPTKEEVYAWALDQRGPWTTEAAPSGFSVALAELAREQGFAYADLGPSLVAASRAAFEERGELLWWADDTHWGAAGQRVAAETIYRELLRPQTSTGP